MTFLLITDDDILIDNFSNKLKSLEKKSKIYNSDFSDKELNKAFSNCSNVSVAFIYSKDKKNITENTITLLSALTGYMIANHTYIITNIDEISKINFFKSTEINTIDSAENLLDFVEKSFNQIVDTNKKNDAKKILLSKGIPFTPDCFALYIAKDKTEICNLFLSADIDINSKDDLGTPLLNIAVRNDNLSFVKKLISKGADINCISEDRGYTPVMDAVWRGNLEITKYLIKQGAELNTINKEGQNNLVLAVGAEKTEICELLVKNGANPDIKDQMGMSAYNYANLFHKQKLIEILKPYHKE